MLRIILRNHKRFLLVGLIAVSCLENARAGGVFPIATSPAAVELAGGVAFDGTNYLVGMTSGTNVVGQSVSTAGKLVGSQFILGSSPGFPPAVAMAGGKSNCLVAWSDYSISSGVNSFGRLVSPSSGPVGPKFPLLASAGTHGFQAVKAAASDGTNFLVVWQDAANTSFYGQFVGASGTLSGSEFIVLAPSDGDGNNNVALAFGKTNYLFAWQNSQNNSNNTYCERISPSGAVGSVFQVNNTASLDGNPLAVAYDGTNYLVVWDRNTQQSSPGQPVWNLCGRLVSPAGVALGSELVMVTEQAAFPALAFDGVNYLLAWGYDATTTNSDTTIHARFLDRSGNSIGPIVTPFSTQGTNPPLLPLNGLLFDGSRFLLAATFGSFVVDGTGDVVGFSGGDVYGLTVSQSTKPPVFTNAAVLNGQFQGQLRVVPGQTYTIESSTNLLSWQARGAMSSDATNLLTLVDPNGVTNSCRMFYRAVIGNSLGTSFDLHFLEFANAGGFGGGFTPAPSLPVSLNSYSAWFDVENDTALPPATNVFFTGPAASGLSNTAADPNNSNIGGSEGSYQSPFIFSPAAAPGGAWVVNYKGTNVSFNVPDPQAASRLVVPLPTVTVSGDVVRSVNWVYRDAATGTVLSSAPAYVTGIQVEIDGIVGGRIYNSPTLGPEAASYALTSIVNWSNVQRMNLAYNDSLGNHYVVSFSKP